MPRYLLCFLYLVQSLRPRIFFMWDLKMNFRLAMSNKLQILFQKSR